VICLVEGVDRAGEERSTAGGVAGVLSIFRSRAEGTCRGTERSAGAVVAGARSGVRGEEITSRREVVRLSLAALGETRSLPRGGVPGAVSVRSP